MNWDEAFAEAQERWSRLSGIELCTMIDYLERFNSALQSMLKRAKIRYESNLHEKLLLAQHPSIDTMEEFRAAFEKGNPADLAAFDRFLLLAAEDENIDEEWIDSETRDIMENPEMNSDRAFDEARDDGRI